MRRIGAHLTDLLPLAVAAWLLATLATVWAGRIGYPYDLEWMEGGMLAHAWRLQQGLPLYAEPGPDWIPFIYPPGYPALLAAFGEIFGISATLGRAISLVGSLSAAAAIVFVVGRHGRSWALGVLGAAVFLGAYPSSGGFYDLVRNDGLFMGLLAWAIALGWERRRGAVEAAGLLLCAAFLVKHNAAMFGFPIAIGLWVRDGWRQAARFAAWSAAPALLLTGYLQWRTEGRFLAYLLEAPAAHPIVGPRAFPGTVYELGLALPVAVVATAIWGVWRSARKAPSASADRQEPVAAAAILPAPSSSRPVWATAAVAALIAGLTLFEVPEAGRAAAGPLLAWSEATGLGLPAVRRIEAAGPLLSMLVMGALAASLVAALAAFAGSARRDGAWVYGAGLLLVAAVTASLMRGHHGGFLNVHMHLHWAVACAFSLAMARWRMAVPSAPVAAVSAVAIALQLGWQIQRFEAEDYVPTAKDREIGDLIVERLRGIEGPVLSPFAPWLPVQAGHEPGFHLIALWDVAQHERTPFPEAEERIAEAMRQRRWGAVLDGPRTMGYGVKLGYEAGGRLPGNSGVFLPKTGWRARPKTILRPKDAAD